MSLAERRAALQSLGLSQQELAEVWGVDPVTAAIAPSGRPGDKVRWQGYTGTFLRETVDDQAEVLIGTRTLRLPKTELRSAGQR